MSCLFGDGVHDDDPAIREKTDKGGGEVVLPAPEKYYMISQILVSSFEFQTCAPKVCRNPSCGQFKLSHAAESGERMHF